MFHVFLKNIKKYQLEVNGGHLSLMDLEMFHGKCLIWKTGHTAMKELEERTKI